MASLKIKVGDNVIVRSGSDKGKTGKVTSINPKDLTAVVEGVNVRKIHKKQSQSVTTAGVYKETMPISIHKIGLPHPSKKNVSGRVGFETDKNGNKKRIYKANNKEVK